MIYTAGGTARHSQVKLVSIGPRSSRTDTTLPMLIFPMEAYRWRGPTVGILAGREGFFGVIRRMWIRNGNRVIYQLVIKVP